MSLLSMPLSLYSIPFAYVIAFYPHNAKVRLIMSTVGWYNSNPREHNYDILIKEGMSSDNAAKASRMAAAHNNGNEVFPLWAAAVLSANFAGIDTKTLNIASGSFLVSRLVYNYIYISQKTMASSALRTITFFLGICSPFYLLIISANKIRAA